VAIQTAKPKAVEEVLNLELGEVDGNRVSNPTNPPQVFHASIELKWNSCIGCYGSS